MRGRPRQSFTIELHAESGDTKINRETISSLAVFKDTIEKKTSEKLIIQGAWGQKWARLYMEYPSGEITEELKVWAVDKMEMLIKILQPEIDKLKS